MQGHPPPSLEPPATAADRFDLLYRSGWTSVLAYALRRSVSRDDALDVTAETFLVAWRRRDDVPLDPDDARAWLFGVARWCLANAQRGELRSTHLRERLAVTLDVAAVPDPARIQEVREDTQVVRRALDRLSADDRELVTLVAWEGLSPAQAGAALGLTPGTARVRLHRARRQLRASLPPAPTSAHAEEDHHDH